MLNWKRRRHAVNTRPANMGGKNFFSFFPFSLGPDAHPEVLVQLLLGEGGAGLRGERGEEEGRVQWGEKRRVRAGAQTPLSDPEVHGRGVPEESGKRRERIKKIIISGPRGGN